jgi:hypothetical protein
MPQGCIHISKAAWQNGHKVPVTQAGWQSALHLPADYQVVDVQSGCAYGDVWIIVVESEYIPDVDGNVLPEIVPMYRRTAGLKEELDYIETRIWDRSAKNWRSLDGVA